MGLGSVLGALADIVAVVAVSCCGGLLNRLRGSGAPNLAVPNSFDYWGEQVFSRGIVAVPLAALVRLTTRDLASTVLIMLAVWSSLLIGWGTYFDLGEPDGYRARIGEFDWLVGREMPGWDFDRRWVRKYPAMMLRGLQWTMPSGYLLAHRGGGWAFALSGALFPVVYTLAQHTGIPQGETQFAFSTGIPWAESVWGCWLWFVVLTSLLARPKRMAKPNFDKPFKGKGANYAFETFTLLLQALNVGSCVYYSHIEQCDKRNWDQTYYGLLLVTGFQLLSHVTVLTARGCCVRQNSADVQLLNEEDEENEGLDTAPLLQPEEQEEFIPSRYGSRRSTKGGLFDSGASWQINHNERSPLLTDVGLPGTASAQGFSRRDPPPFYQQQAPLSPSLLPVAAAAAANEPAAAPSRGRGRASRSVKSVFYPPGISPFRELRALVQLLCVLAVLLGTVMLFVAIGWGAHSDRYCQSMDVLTNDGSLVNICLGDDTLQDLGCANLDTGDCWQVVQELLPPTCALPV